MISQLISSLFLAVFLLSAVVQYNDPDAALWIALYLSAALMFAARLLNRPVPWLPPVLIAICLLWLTLLLSRFAGQVTPAEIVESLNMQSRGVEEAREAGGLLLVLIGSLLVAVTRRAPPPRL